MASVAVLMLPAITPFPAREFRPISLTQWVPVLSFRAMKYATPLLLLVVLSCRSTGKSPDASWAPTIPVDAKERHFKSVRQLTSAGIFAEAYWSPDGTKLILQRADLAQEGQAPPGNDQIYIMDVATGEMNRVSNGEGKCT